MEEGLFFDGVGVGGRDPGKVEVGENACPGSRYMPQAPVFPGLIRQRHWQVRHFTLESGSLS